MHVVGAVGAPGVVRLAPGSRVQDALAAAGGATGQADLAQVNLARPVADGEQIVVPTPGQQVAAGAGAAAVAPATGGAKARSGPVNLNSATAEQLDALPGIGPVLANRIVEWRTSNGPFTSVDELGEVSGIGAKLLSQVRSAVSV